MYDYIRYESGYNRLTFFLYDSVRLINNFESMLIKISISYIHIKVINNQYIMISYNLKTISIRNN